MKQLLLTVIITFFTGILFAQTDSACINITGEIPQSVWLCAADFAAIPHITVAIQDKKGAPTQYSGVPVADILARAGAFSGEHKADMAKYLLVACADGYKVLFALQDFDRNFGNKTAILADKANGKPLPRQTGPYRIIVAGEKKQGRSCYKVTTFVIGSVKH